jgi:hypothetical protein
MYARVRRGLNSPDLLGACTSLPGERSSGPEGFAPAT